MLLDVLHSLLDRAAHAVPTGGLAVLAELYTAVYVSAGFRGSWGPVLGRVGFGGSGCSWSCFHVAYCSCGGMDAYRRMSRNAVSLPADTYSTI